MSPQVHAQVDGTHFEIVGPTLSNTIREFRRLLYRTGCKCKHASTDFEKIVYNLGKVILVVEIKEVYAGMAHGPQLT